MRGAVQRRVHHRTGRFTECSLFVCTAGRSERNQKGHQAGRHGRTVVSWHVGRSAHNGGNRHASQRAHPLQPPELGVARKVEKAPSRHVRTGGSSTIRMVRKSGKSRLSKALFMSDLPGKTSTVLTLSDGIAAVSRPALRCGHPLALLSTIRTLNVVQREGATLVRESGTGAQRPVSRARISQSHPESDRDAGRRSLDVDPNSARFPRPSVVCAFHGE